LKPAAFEYHAPATLLEAVDLLATADAAVIAGGQSLMPLLAFRLAAPSLLVDLRRVPDLDTIAINASGVRLGAKVRWCDIERHDGLATTHPLLREGVSHVAHYAVRNRGTVGGSLAHADPAAELPGIAVACDADIVLFGASGERVVAAADFFTGPLSTARQSNEIVTGLRLPAWPEKRRWAFREFAQRRGDFALAGVALWYDEDTLGRIGDAHVGVIGVSDRPRRLPMVEAMLNGETINDELIREAAARAAQSVDPPTDLHADPDYRRALVATLVERALRAVNAAGH